MSMNTARLIVSAGLQLFVCLVYCNGGIWIQPPLHENPYDSPLVSKDARAAMLEWFLKVPVKMLEWLEYMSIRINHN
jgi:hypothetical protein